LSFIWNTVNPSLRQQWQADRKDGCRRAGIGWWKKRRPFCNGADRDCIYPFAFAQDRLSFKTLPGAQLRYWVTAGDRLVALLGFGAAAWQCAPRDQFIGWTHEQCQNNLHFVVNNARFLILPWVCSDNHAYKVLGLAARQLPQDWQHRYGFRPLLLETFVKKPVSLVRVIERLTGFMSVKTKGRGKLGPSGKQSVPINLKTEVEQKYKICKACTL